MTRHGARAARHGPDAEHGERLVRHTEHSLRGKPWGGGEVDAIGEAVTRIPVLRCIAAVDASYRFVPWGSHALQQACHG